MDGAIDEGIDKGVDGWSDRWMIKGSVGWREIKQHGGMKGTMEIGINKCSAKCNPLSINSNVV